MKERIDEHDMTKKMMDIMRGGYKSRLITEAEEQPEQQSDSMVEKEVMDGDDTINTDIKIKEQH
jgi:hypothetical protein